MKTNNRFSPDMPEGSYDGWRERLDQDPEHQAFIRKLHRDAVARHRKPVYTPPEPGKVAIVLQTACAWLFFGGLVVVFASLSFKGLLAAILFLHCL